MKPTYHVTISGLLCLSLLAACREDLPQPALEVVGLEKDTPSSSHNHSEFGSSDEDHSLMPKAGPDEAFFANAFLAEVLGFLEQPTLVIQALENYNPNYFALAENAEVQWNAFDFRQNFSEQRMEIMVDMLLVLNDRNQDKSLQLAELQSLKLNPKILGNPGSIQQYHVDDEIFKLLKGDAEALHADHLKVLLKALGSLAAEEGERLAIRSYRSQILDSWELVLRSYDQDQDGLLNHSEYRRLRSDRQEKLEHLRRQLARR